MKDNHETPHPQGYESTPTEDESEQKSFIEEIKIYFRNYCNHTGIHGFQYFGQHRTLIEKLCWILVFMATFSACSFCIYQIYEKWATSPVIVSLATKETPIYQIPFPAVTICPTIKFSQKCFDTGSLSTKKVKGGKLSFLQKKFLGYSRSLCKAYHSNSHENFKQEDYYNDDFFEKLLKCSPFTGGNFSVKFMSRRNIEFSEVFHPIITEDGMCFAFNMMNMKELVSDEYALYPGLGEADETSSWIPQVGYPEDASLETYPRRALLSGGLNSLEITMGHLESDIDYICNGREQGYKVLLHIPSRLARPALDYILVPFNKATTITVIPEMMSTSSRVKKYNSETRNCFFPGEKDLRFFKVYTKTSCDMECLSNYTLNFCGCVAFWMPRLNTTKMCGPAKLNCVIIARENYDLSKLRDKLEEERLKRKLAAAKMNKTIESLTFWETHEHNAMNAEIESLEDQIDSVKSKCNCIPICSDLTYIGTATSLDIEQEQKGKNTLHSNKSTFGLTQITIFLKTNEIFTRERNELYGLTDFISNFGGLLGLFSGFSILSFMEIVYYLSFRIIGNLKKFGRWYGTEE
ncbi:pickpocket protein 28-like [Harmonia axyridis]|uniref:pickpocket protein 28-like n=1 Tax=Harmonia axyridis TaxID=115357 RepID=UPI001E276F2E|nr:pickpocket protein 28-like [Harmonia axyridis]